MTRLHIFILSFKSLYHSVSVTHFSLNIHLILFLKSQLCLLVQSLTLTIYMTCLLISIRSLNHYIILFIYVTYFSLNIYLILFLMPQSCLLVQSLTLSIYITRLLIYGHSLSQYIIVSIYVSHFSLNIYLMPHLCLLLKSLDHFLYLCGNIFVFFLSHYITISIYIASVIHSIFWKKNIIIFIY